jgi:hypothetical protein
MHSSQQAALRDSGRPGKALEIENWSFAKLLLNFLQAAKRGFHARSPEASAFTQENRLPELQLERRRGKNSKRGTSWQAAQILRPWLGHAAV